MKKYYLFPILFLLLVSCKDGSTNNTRNTTEEKELSVVEKIAKANGIGDFEAATLLQYTFNVKINDSLATSRSWKWNLDTQQVTLAQDDSLISYNHEKEAGNYAQVDQKFINDQYWLLFPFHLVWDEMEYEHNFEANAPISKKSMQQLIVTYPENRGYTPGDVYEIYFDEDFIIREWTFKRGGSEESPLSTTWDGYQSFKGIKISTMHKNAEGDFKLFFDQVKVTK